MTTTPSTGTDRSALTDAARSRGRLPGTAAFAVTALTLLAVLAAAGTPAPLYIVYQERYRIPDAGLTAAFAIYIVPIVVALLTCGRLSDHIGRRPPAMAAPLLGATACLVLANVHGLGMLLLGRGLQGLATGLGTSALGVFLLDLHPPGRLTLAAALTSLAPMAGVAGGAVLSGTLVQYGPHPTTLVYALFAGLLGVCAVGIALAPETSPRLPGALASMRPVLRVPASVRPVFLATGACLVASWALGGFYQALAPSLTARVLGLPDHLVGGLAVAALIGTSGLGVPLAARFRPPVAMLLGTVVLVLGTLAVLGMLTARHVPGFFLASVVTGLGCGAAIIGGIRTLVEPIPQLDRAAVLSAAYLVAYLGAAIPPFLSGALVPRFGLYPVTVGYGGLVVVLGLLAAGITLAQRRR